MKAPEMSAILRPLAVLALVSRVASRWCSRNVN
jgi:hypothetical protein